jgi:hypothetical protein
MTEDELRELAGVPVRPEVVFLDTAYKIREDGLAPLLRFTRDSSDNPNPEAGTPLPVIYRLLQDCLIDFGAFEAAALAGRADMGDLRPVINALISFYCGRSHWPAMRLIGFIAANLDELDGRLIRAGGRGVASLTAREACNLALAVCLDGRSEEDRQVFMSDLLYEADATLDALAQLREFQRQKAEAEAAEAAGG